MRFVGDLLVPGVFVVEDVPLERQLDARSGVVVSETTTATGDRAWTVLDHQGRTFVLTDNQVHACPAACPMCPRMDRRALRLALGRALTHASHRTGPWTWADHNHHNHIRTLTRALRTTT